jgi:hypothetical protein
MQKRVVYVKALNIKESTEPKILQIIKGNINYLFPNGAINKLSEERLAICKVCPLYIKETNRCDTHNYIAHSITGNPVKGCGCKLLQKTKNYNSNCPAMKWGAYENEEAYLSEKGENLI